MPEYCNLFIVFSCSNGSSRLILFLPFFQNETGRVGLEGAVCDDYYKIRELLYQQYAVV